MMPAVLATVVLLAALLGQEWVLDPSLPSRLTKNDLARGKRLYAAYCESCHGADGDDTTQPGITPLAGLSLRLPDPRVRKFGGPAFRARGRIYPPEEARALMAYILTLPGEKGFRHADALVSPYLLTRKFQNRNYLVIDVRSKAEFRKTHIRGAVNLPLDDFTDFLRPALAPDLSKRIVVLYDEGPGLRASRVWRALFQSGHREVAVLDGGFKRWISEDCEVTTEISALSPSRLLIESRDQVGPSPASPSGAHAVEMPFDWRRTVTEKGVRNASELTHYFQSAGFKGPGLYRPRGESETADLFAYLIHLLGFAVQSAGAREVVVR